MGSLGQIIMKTKMALRRVPTLCALLTALALAGCAAPSRYMGIDISQSVRPERVEGFQERADLHSLASRAQSGDKQAQLELGIRFEEGRGVTRDLKKARKLYAKAATSSGGTIWVYSPPVGNGTSGRVIPVNAGPRQHGLAEAKRRLEGLE